MQGDGCCTSRNVPVAVTCDVGGGLLPILHWVEVGFGSAKNKSTDISPQDKYCNAHLLWQTFSVKISLFEYGQLYLIQQRSYFPSLTHRANSITNATKLTDVWSDIQEDSNTLPMKTNLIGQEDIRTV